MYIFRTVYFAFKINGSFDSRKICVQAEEPEYAWNYSASAILSELEAWLRLQQVWHYIKYQKHPTFHQQKRNFARER